MQILKRCTRCGLEATAMEDLELFSKEKKKKYGRRNECKNCSNERSKESRMRNPLSTKDQNDRSRAKREYGITLEEYKWAMSTSKECYACGSISQLCYDHDHSMPKDINSFRGILCTNCNVALGRAKDDITILSRLIEYQHSWSKKDEIFFPEPGLRYE